MSGKEKLIDRRHVLQPVAAIDKDAEIPCQGAGIARHGHDHGNLRAGELLRLGLGAGAGRIKNDRVEASELLGGKGVAEQVTYAGCDRFDTLGMPRGRLQGGDQLPVAVEGRNRRRSRQPERQRA